MPRKGHSLYALRQVQAAKNIREVCREDRRVAAGVLQLEAALHGSEDRHEDDAPAAPKNPTSRVGDLWFCGQHRIHSPQRTRRSPLSSRPVSWPAW
jgi:hypothetical protein